jgi:hypothetical protein
VQIAERLGADPADSRYRHSRSTVTPERARALTRKAMAQEHEPSPVERFLNERGI